MDTAQYKSSRYPQSPTHRSPELAPISLTSMAESYERLHTNQTTEAQKFAQEQRMQQQQQQQQQTISTSLGSSTMVGSISSNNSNNSNGMAMNIHEAPLAMTASTSSSSISLFGSALSVDNEQENITMGMHSDTIDDDDDDDGRLAIGHPTIISSSSNSDGSNAASSDSNDDEAPFGPRKGSDEGTDNHLISMNNDDHDDDSYNGEWRGYRCTPHDDDDDDADNDDEWRGYRRTPCDDDIDDGDDLASPTKQGGDHMDDTTPAGMDRHIHIMGGGEQGIWQTYRPDYFMLNDSYQATKRIMYKDIETTLGHLQQLESDVEASQLQFHGRVEEAYETWSQQLDTQRQQLAHRHRTMNEDHHHPNRNDSQQPSSSSCQNRGLVAFQTKIKLNVGGDIFETSLATLKKDGSSLLAIMFSGKHTMQPDQEGAYFIDRDPTHFRLVLNYLRDLRISPSVIQDKLICQELLQEAEFYRIDGLVKLLV